MFDSFLGSRLQLFKAFYLGGEEGSDEELRGVLSSGINWLPGNNAETVETQESGNGNCATKQEPSFFRFFETRNLSEGSEMDEKEVRLRGNLSHGTIASKALPYMCLSN